MDIVNKAIRFSRLYATYLIGSYLQTVATFRPAKKFKIDVNAKGNIVLVPGLFCSGGVMNTLGTFLKKAGYNVFISPTFPVNFSFIANTCRFEKSAGVLRNFLQKLKKEKGIDRVYLVGHSNGGIISGLAYFEEDKKEDLPELLGIISMGSPFYGSSAAKLVSFIVPQAREIVPESETVKKISNFKDLYLHHLVSGFDAIVPPKNQYFEGIPKTFFENYQHTDFIVGSKKKIKKVAATIDSIIKRKEGIND